MGCKKEKYGERRIERIRYRERHRGVYKRRDMVREGVRELDIYIEREAPWGVQKERYGERRIERIR